MRRSLGASWLAAAADGSWLTARRIRVYLWLSLVVNGAVLALWAVTALLQGGVDPDGKAIGTDFTSFWAASKLALQGQAAAAYDVATHHATQRAALAGKDVVYAAFFYPPPYLLLCLPLALAPYFVSLCLWLLSTGAACWAAVRRLVGPEPGVLAFAAFPAALITLSHGQNAFLTTALVATGFLSLDRRPMLAGCAFGALVMKPQLAILLPVLLIAGRRWTALVASAAAALSLCLLATAVFGIDIWRAYLAVTPLAREALEADLVGAAKMQSVFAAVRLWGGSVTLAYAVQAASAAAAIAALLRLLLSAPRSAAAGPATVVATLLVTPFLLDYDLMLLAIPMAFLFREGRRGGFLPWEKTVLFAAYALPLFARPLALTLSVPLTPFVAAALLAVVVRRGMAVDPATALETRRRFPELRDR